MSEFIGSVFSICGNLAVMPGMTAGGMKIGL